MEIVVTENAQKHIDKIFNYYEGKVDGLGLKFISRLNDELNRIQLNPESANVAFDDIRRGLLKTFHYAVFYKIEDLIILILSIRHTSQDFPQSESQL